MYSGHDIVAVFCDDVREEKTGADTIVGVMKDSIRVSQLPGIAPKLFVYLRINATFDALSKQVSVRLDTPWGETIPLGEITDELADEARQTFEKHGAPIVTVIAKTEFVPFKFIRPGRLSVVATVGGVDRVVGTLNVIGTEVSESELQGVKSD